MWSSLKRHLLARADKTRDNFRLLIAGFLGFLAGGATVMLSGLLLQPSLLQEVLAAAGLIMMGVGIILAALGYISLSILRLFRHFNNEPGND